MQIICSVFDKAGAAYSRPFSAPTVAMAIREFGMICQEPEHQFNKFPEDYSLVQLATWDELKGVITPVKEVKLAMATDYILTPMGVEENGA